MIHEMGRLAHEGYVMFSCVFVTFPYGILGQVRCEKEIKCSASYAFYRFFPTRLIKLS